MLPTLYQLIVKILSATCEVAIKLSNIAFQQVLSIVKIAIAHAFGKLITVSLQILNECDMMASLKDKFIYDKKKH